MAVTEGGAMAWSRVRSVALLGSLVLVVAASAVGAAPGELDPTFGEDGTVVFSEPLDRITSTRGAGIAVLADGKLLVAGGDFEVYRLQPDGSLDRSFGVLGRVAPVPELEGPAEAFELQPDGKMLLAGSHEEQMVVLRFHPDGVLDTSFGENGRFTLDLSPDDDRLHGLALQADGSILAAGRTGDLWDQPFSVLMRLTPSGDLDPSFGTNGLVLMGSGLPIENDRHMELFDVAVQPDARIVASGVTSNCAGVLPGDGCDVDAMVVRHLANGELDPSFGSGGIATFEVSADRPAGTPPTPYEAPFAIALQPDGAVVVAGEASWSLVPSDFLLARFDHAGILDPTFGGDGVVITDFTGEGETATELAIQADGRIVVVGGNSRQGINDTPPAFRVARYNSDGSLDATFGQGGKTTTRFAGAASAESVAIQPDGRLLAGGWTTCGNPCEGPLALWAVARYLADALPECTILGTRGDDRLIGTSGSDVICGGPGNDTIEGGDGNDVLVGGPGNDVTRGGSGDDTVHGGPGRDVLVGGLGADELAGGADDDALDGADGTSGNDTLDGASGNDTCVADPGDPVSSCP